VTKDAHAGSEAVATVLDDEREADLLGAATWGHACQNMNSCVRPRKRSTISASLRGQPSRAKTAASTRTARRSLSTSTPSESKITSLGLPHSYGPLACRAASFGGRAGHYERLDRGGILAAGSEGCLGLLERVVPVRVACRFTRRSAARAIAAG
jgi:hypothetical protein